MFIQGNRKLASKTKLNMSKTWSVNVCAFLSLVRFSSAVVVVSWCILDKQRDHLLIWVQHSIYPH